MDKPIDDQSFNNCVSLKEEEVEIDSSNYQF